MNRQLPTLDEVPTLWAACNRVIKSNMAGGYAPRRFAQTVGNCRNDEDLRAACARLILQDENLQDLHKAFVLDRHTNLLTIEDLVCAYGVHYRLSAEVTAASCRRAQEFDEWVGLRRWASSSTAVMSAQLCQKAMPALPEISPEVTEALRALAEYRTIRRSFLQRIGCPSSNRDPLAEFSERLVAQLFSGGIAESRVQKDFDVIGSDQQRIQVKYLANPRGAWINEHHIQFHGEMDAYALVLFEDLWPTLVLVFPRDQIERVCQLLEKRHPDQASTLQLTQRNVKAIQSDPEEFERLGVNVIQLPPGDSF